MKLRQHVFLTGFMASGKTTAGKKLATLLEMPFTDLDAYLETKENRSISRIFEEDGEAKFREIETQCLKELLNLQEAHIISLGGGTVCFSSNLELIKQKGILVYIELPAKALAERIRLTSATRPLLKDLPPEALLKNIETLLAGRKKFYEQAQITVNGLNLTPQLIRQKLLDLAKENTL